MGLAEDVRAILEWWDEGRLAKSEVEHRLAARLMDVNVGDLLALAPDESRDALAEYLRDLAEGGPVVRVFGGMYTYAREPDPTRRATRMAAVERLRAEETARFDRVVLPALRAWLARHG